MSVSTAACVVLAAGASRRLGRPKQLLRVEGESLLRRMARLAGQAGFQPVLVVCGHESARLRAELTGLESVSITNERWAEGLSTSIRAGVSAVPGACTGALLLTCDQPAVDAALLERLRNAHEADPARAVACAYADTLGIPALFPRRLFGGLTQLEGDRGAGAWLRAHAGEVLAIPFPGGALDLDTPEDLALWRERP